MAQQQADTGTLNVCDDRVCSVGFEVEYLRNIVHQYRLTDSISVRRSYKLKGAPRHREVNMHVVAEGRWIDREDGKTRKEKGENNQLTDKLDTSRC